jgi:hypothetical protein
MCFPPKTGIMGQNAKKHLIFVRLKFIYREKNTHCRFLPGRCG